MRAKISKILANSIFVIFVAFYPLLLFVAIVQQFCNYLKKKEVKSIKGDIAVVTGGASGLGKEICIELAKQGCHIAVVDINAQQAENTAKFVSECFDVQGKSYKVDVTNYEEVKALNMTIINDFGTPATILINNAGVLVFSNLKQPDYREVQRMINVNLTAHFWTIDVFLPNMKAVKKGHITAISSASGLIPLIYNAQYTSTKFGVRALMRTLRTELKVASYKNIITTTVFPVFLETNQTVSNLVKNLSVDKIYPLIPGDEAAKRIVNGMLVNEENIYLPDFFALAYRLIDLLPTYWQDLPVVSLLGTRIKAAFNKNIA